MTKMRAILSSGYIFLSTFLTLPPPTTAQSEPSGKPPPVLAPWPPRPPIAAAGVNNWPAGQPYLRTLPKYSLVFGFHFHKIEITFSDDACWTVSQKNLTGNITRRELSKAGGSRTVDVDTSRTRGEGVGGQAIDLQGLYGGEGHQGDHDLRGLDNSADEVDRRTVSGGSGAEKQLRKLRGPHPLEAVVRASGELKPEFGESEYERAQRKSGGKCFRLDDEVCMEAFGTDGGSFSQPLTVRGGSRSSVDLDGRSQIQGIVRAAAAPVRILPDADGKRSTSASSTDTELALALPAPASAPHRSSSSKAAVSTTQEAVAVQGHPPHNRQKHHHRPYRQRELDGKAAEKISGRFEWQEDYPAVMVKRTLAAALRKSKEKLLEGAGDAEDHVEILAVSPEDGALVVPTSSPGNNRDRGMRNAVVGEVNEEDRDSRTSRSSSRPHRTTSSSASSSSSTSTRRKLLTNLPNTPDLAACKHACYQAGMFQCRSITYDPVTKHCTLFQMPDAGRLNNYCFCDGFLGWEPQYAEYVGIETYSWRLARGRKLEGECLPGKCVIKDMDPNKKWRFRVRFYCEKENPLILRRESTHFLISAWSPVSGIIRSAAWSPISGIIRSMNLPPAGNMTQFLTQVASANNVLGDLRIWLRTEMGLATRAEEIASRMQKITVISFPDGSETRRMSPFYYDLETVMRAHVFHLRAYVLEMNIEAVITGSGLAGGLDLQDMMTLDQRTILNLVSGGEEVNLSHGYIGIRCTFEVVGGISFIEVDQTEQVIRSHLHNLIWNRDGLTPMEVDLLVPQLEAATLTTATTEDPTIRDSVLVLGGNFDQKNLSAMAAETAIAVMCFLFVLLYLLSAFSYYQLFIVNNAIDPANALRPLTLPWQFFFCACNRVPHNHFLLAKNMRQERGYWYFWLRYHLSWVLFPCCGPAFLQMFFHLQIDTFAELGLMPASQSKYSYPGLVLRWNLFLKRKRMRPIFKKGEHRPGSSTFLTDRASSTSEDHTNVAPPPQRIKDIVPKPPDWPERGEAMNGLSYFLKVVKTYGWQDYKQWARHLAAVVLFLPWVCGEYDYSERVQRMTVVIPSERQKREKEVEMENKLMKEDTKKMAAAMFLENATMSPKGKKSSNKIAPAQGALTGHSYVVPALENGEEEDSKGGSRAMAIPDAFEIASSTAKTSSLSKEDLAIVKKAKQAQFGRRWLLFANPQTRQLYWHNRDTKVQVKVDAKYTKNLKLVAPWEADLDQYMNEEDSGEEEEEEEGGESGRSGGDEEDAGSAVNETPGEDAEDQDAGGEGGTFMTAPPDAAEGQHMSMEPDPRRYTPDDVTLGYQDQLDDDDELILIAESDETPPGIEEDRLGPLSSPEQQTMT